MSEPFRTVTRFERADFYADWLAASERNEEELRQPPVVARGRELQWIETVNDFAIGMLIGSQVGFPTSGTNLCKVRIPVGHHTGLHCHGEEAIHLLQGTGFIMVDGRRYDFRPGTTIHVPFAADHQLFNTGTDEIELVSASAMDLDLFARLGRLEQHEPKGANLPGFESRIPAEDGQCNAAGRRIALHLEDAPDEQKRREARRMADAAAVTSGSAVHTPAEHARGSEPGAGHDPADGHASHGSPSGHGGHAGPRGEQNPHRHGAIYILMGGGESPSEDRNGFEAVSVAMTNIFEEVPHTSSHCHSHTEAVLYVLEGVGFSEIDYKHFDWQAGDAVHVPPRMTRHEHFNPSDQRTRTLRIEFGIRYFYEPLWKGFAKVEHRDTAITRP
jgi:mannose-6-phosphate isomerase-like protein (cupin superfamily)